MLIDPARRAADWPPGPALRPGPPAHLGGVEVGRVVLVGALALTLGGNWRVTGWPRGDHGGPGVAAVVPAQLRWSRPHSPWPRVSGAARPAQAEPGDDEEVTGEPPARTGRGWWSLVRAGTGAPVRGQQPLVCTGTGIGGQHRPTRCQNAASGHWSIPGAAPRPVWGHRAILGPAPHRGPWSVRGSPGWTGLYRAGPGSPPRAPPGPHRPLPAALLRPRPFLPTTVR